MLRLLSLTRPKTKYAWSLAVRQKNIVLVVDDETLILRMVTAALATVGFRAMVAENGITGLETYAAMRDEICLILTDLKMPICSGVEMADRILELDSKAKILLMSGYSDDDLVVQGKKRFPFINKPFLPEDLIRKVRFVLGDADPTAD